MSVARHDNAARSDDCRPDLNFIPLDRPEARKVVARGALSGLPHLPIRLLKAVNQLVLLLLLDLFANNPSKVVNFVQLLLLWVTLSDFDLPAVKLILLRFRVPLCLIADQTVAFRPLRSAIEAGKLLSLFLCLLHRAPDKLIAASVSGGVHSTLRPHPVEAALVSQVLKKEL